MYFQYRECFGLPYTLHLKVDFIDMLTFLECRVNLKNFNKIKNISKTSFQAILSVSNCNVCLIFISGELKINIFSCHFERFKSIFE